MFPVEKTVRARYSARTYDSRPVEDYIKEKISNYAEMLENPLGPKCRYKLLDRDLPEKGKLGTYGIIKGAELYIGVCVPEDECALEALGYEFEKLVLYMTSLGLGTCWLGGTFNRSTFASVMDLKEGELFPIVSPIGYPAEKRSLMETLMRKGAGSDKRRPWEEMFFKGDFDTPLTEKEAGDYAFCLEMVKLAPSAVNRQPWRIVKEEGCFHFYEAHTRENEEPDPMDMHRIDLGIAICHFHLAAEEKGLKGRFERNQPAIEKPDHCDYITTWIME